MLLLSRRIGETIVIDHSIRITVLKISGTTRRYVQLGIEAPGRPIMRAELLERPIDPAIHAPSPAHAASPAGEQAQLPRTGGGNG